MGDSAAPSPPPTTTDIMFSHFQKPLVSAGRQLSTSAVNMNAVAVMGASGGIGQPLSMLLKLNPGITKLALYDIVHTPGVAADLSHIETKAVTTGFVGADQLEASLAGAEIVVIPAGVPRKPGMTRVVTCSTPTPPLWQQSPLPLPRSVPRLCWPSSPTRLTPPSPLPLKFIRRQACSTPRRSSA